MQFGLLVPQLPHVEEARTQYNDLLVLDARSHASSRVATAIWTALKKLTH